MAHDLQDENIPVNLLVYVDGSLLGSEADRPANVERVINVRVPGYVWSSTDRPEADNVQLESADTFSAATDRQTLDLLAHELMLIAMTVPEQSLTLPTPPPLPAAPTPRPVQRVTSKTRDEWDFLKATAQPESRPARSLHVAPGRGHGEGADASEAAHHAQAEGHAKGTMPTPPPPHTTLKPIDTPEQGRFSHRESSSQQLTASRAA